MAAEVSSFGGQDPKINQPALATAIQHNGYRAKIIPKMILRVTGLIGSLFDIDLIRLEGSNSPHNVAASLFCHLHFEANRTPSSAYRHSRERA
jgi:hypothetical protein